MSRQQRIARLARSKSHTEISWDLLKQLRNARTAYDQHFDTSFVANCVTLVLQPDPQEPRMHEDAWWSCLFCKAIALQTRWLRNVSRATGPF
jgi:hypothetical protein